MQFQNLEEKIIYNKLSKGQSEDLIFHQNFQSGRNEFNGNMSMDSINLFTNNAKEHILNMEATRNVTSYKNIYSNRKSLGNLAVFAKRVVRKLTAWYVEPVCQQQTSFNSSTSPAVGCLVEVQKEVVKGVVQLQAQQQAQQQTLSDVQASYDAKHVELEVNLVNINKALNEKYMNLEKTLNEVTEQIAAKQAQFENIQNIGNQQISLMQRKIDRLKELELDIFSEQRDLMWDLTSFSQSGEDSIISLALQVMGLSLSEITYLDLGANHAKEISNTYYFYRHGARGVLVEANPDLIPELKFYRNGDVILNMCISEKSGDTIDFYVLSGDGLSTPEKESVDEFIAENPNISVDKIVKVETITVNEIIEKYLDRAPIILNIDIEGKEMDILETIDFVKYRPVVIIIEMIPYKNNKLVIENKNQEILNFMNKQGYVEYAFTGINSIFLDKSQVGSDRE